MLISEGRKKKKLITEKLLLCCIERILQFLKVFVSPLKYLIKLKCKPDEVDHVRKDFA